MHIHAAFFLLCKRDRCVCKGSMKQVEQHPKHPFHARIIVSIIMLGLAFVGLIITDISKNYALLYWQLMAPVYAALCIGLSAYIRHSTRVLRLTTIWHEILHWIGLGACVLLVWYFVDIGIVGRFDAALMVLTLLALTTFLVGVYVDYSFILIGIMLGVFAASTAFLEVYLFGILLPLTIAVGAGLYFFIRFRHKRLQSDNEPTQEEESRND